MHSEDGEQRSEPLLGDMWTEQGMANAVRFLQWVGKNMPGIPDSRNGRARAETLVSLGAGHA